MIFFLIQLAENQRRYAQKTAVVFIHPNGKRQEVSYRELAKCNTKSLIYEKR